MSAPSIGEPPIRTAVVGLGWAARSIWLPRLRHNPAFTVTAAVDPDERGRAAVAEAKGMDRLPVLAAVHDLDPAEVDLAVVAVPNHLHCAVAAELLAKGIPVFLEKPVCLTSEEAEQLAEAERSGGAMLLAGSAARYRADVRGLYRIAARLGHIRHVELAWVRSRGVPDRGGWFTQRSLAGGGALVDLGWHLFDIAVPLLGTAAFRHAIGTVSSDFIVQRSSRAAWRGDDGDGPALLGANGGATDVEDTARGFLITDDGRSVVLHASWASHEELDTTRVTIDGSAGSATLRCTFGFSPNRLEKSTLTRTVDGTTRPVAVPTEPVGTEYDRQLDMLPAQLRDPAGRGRVIDEVRRTIGAIERVYASARIPREVRESASV
ncbi:Gfo/Idh/MocA family oxidoreductase [Streptomyces malaysiensis subsp. malaysiensis]|uniref:Gfo/Idh/MocA family oxidoreductase n=1 Tax=Streptomyces malaysiensis TaxID=92644 RepID=A0ABX6VYY3_STRMQ|nr:MULTISPECIES: Gfo/Idh/MocA family oxidoreductase [Streptomyces]QPI54512.1 Gfo/Idh/MocA family oxidoreductase [Streptomyces solisilvae]UHH15907.1 Gfo/Idh/MocA family oxidoreductase [Streptomyces sp. HNM0561]